MGAVVPKGIFSPIFRDFSVFYILCSIFLVFFGFFRWNLLDSDPGTMRK